MLFEQSLVLNPVSLLLHTAASSTDVCGGLNTGLLLGRSAVQQEPLEQEMKIWKKGNDTKSNKDTEMSNRALCERPIGVTNCSLKIHSTKHPT